MPPRINPDKKARGVTESKPRAKNKMSVEHTDDAHVALVNSYIDTFNRSKKEGYDPDFVSSAATAASAGFAAYAIVRTGATVNQKVLDYLASIYIARLIDFLHQNHPDALSDTSKKKN